MADDRGMGREIVRTLVADNLRLARTFQRVSQTHVADEMRARGFDRWSRVTVSEVERYRRGVSIEEAVALAGILDLQLSDLLSTAVTSGFTRDAENGG